MFRPVLFALAIVLGIAHAPAPIAARALENWSYARLMEESDLVVIAVPESSKETADRSKDNSWKVVFEGIDTKFKVEAVFKGKADLKSVTVLHYRVPKDKLILNGPLDVVFRTTAIEFNTATATVAMSRPSYMLFLKARKDGRYEPVSGVVDPALSVREISHPWSGELVGEKGR